MAYSKAFNISYKPNSKESIYFIGGVKKRFEFVRTQKKSLKLITENGVDTIVCNTKSFFNNDLKLNFKMDINFHDVEFIQKGDCTGYKVKGRYNATPIDWTWKRSKNSNKFELIDKNNDKSVIAEISGLTLDNKLEGQITIVNYENANFEEIIIGISCLVYYTELETKKSEKSSKAFGKIEQFKKLSSSK